MATTDALKSLYSQLSSGQNPTPPSNDPYVLTSVLTSELATKADNQNTLTALGKKVDVGGVINTNTGTPAFTGAQPLPVSTILANRVDPRFLRQSGDADWTAALQRAANIACSTGAALYIPPGVLATSQPITLTANLSIIGDGESVAVIAGTHNGPIFSWTVNTTTQDRFVVSGFTLRGQYAVGATYDQTSAFSIFGDSTSLLQYGRFCNLAVEGVYSGWDFQKASATSQFGPESTAAWMTFDRITFQSGNNPIVYGWRYRNGSGTGNTYSHIKGGVSQGGAIIRVDSGVAGDIIVENGHFSGTGTTNYIISLGSSTVYRTNISIVASQLDAGVIHAFDFPSDTVVPTRIAYIGNNTGGGVDVTGNLPLLAHSIIYDQLVDDRRIENLKGGTVSGTASDPSRTVPIAKLTIGSGSSNQPYNGVVLEVVLGGLLGGVAGAAAKASVLISNSAGNASATVLGLQQDASTGFSISTTVSGTVVTINAVYPAAASGACYVEAQVIARGAGSYGLARV